MSKRSVEQSIDILPDNMSIDDIVQSLLPSISIVGVGGAGCNIVTWMKEKDVAGARIFALNSDANHLTITKADKRVLIGYNVTGGLGCGGYPERGAQAAEENSDEIRELLKGSNLVFITAGLGGGTGTGGAPVVAEIARDLGALTLGVVTIPFKVEKARLNLPLREAFNVANQLIAKFIKNVSETVAVPSLMNLDFADLRGVLVGSGVCAVGVGEGIGDGKVDDAVENALSNQLLDIGPIEKAKGALLHVEGGDDMTLEDVNRAGELIIERVSSEAKVSWGARINSGMTGSLSATVILAGIESPFLADSISSYRPIKNDLYVNLET
jgi:cell division protein FtsZ